MFNKLVASSKNHPHRAWNPGMVALSVLAHLLVFAALYIATRPDKPGPAAAPKPEDITYVDVSEIPPPPEPEPEPKPAVQQPQHAPTPPQATPRLPRNRPPVSKSNEVAGTQELKAPPKITGIPEPSAAPPVKAEDFGGRGTLGGTAAGAPPPPSSGTSAGSGNASGDSVADHSGTYSSAMVDHRAELINREEIRRRLQQLYPSLLRDAGVTGKVSVQMVVGADGRVDMSTAKILSTSHEAFADVTMTVLKDLRFKPARIGDNNVRMLTIMPVTWNLQH